jgi:hypothetical protein
MKSEHRTARLIHPTSEATVRPRPTDPAGRSPALNRSGSPCVYQGGTVGGDCFLP